MIFLVAILLGSWIAWRAWKFTILPILRPSEIKELPYWIPCHAISLYRDIDGTVSNGRNYFGNTPETFALTVAGQKIYIMTSTANVFAVLNNSQTFDNGKPKTFLMRRFGVSTKALETIYGQTPTSQPDHKTAKTSPKPKYTAAPSERLLSKQLNPGKAYDDFEIAFLSAIEERLRWNAISPKAVLSLQGAKPAEQTVSLLKLVRQTLVESTTVALFGPAILRICPDFVDNYLRFDDKLQMFLQKLPSPWTSTVEVSVQKLHESIRSYFDLPKEQRSGAAWIVTSLETDLRARGIQTRDIVGWFVMIYWGMNTNNWRLGFWLSAYLVHDRNLLTAIREETMPIIKGQTTPSSLYNHLKRCKRLTSVYHEVLRLVDSPISIRESTCAQTSALGEPLPAGATVMLMNRQLLLDEEVWGADAKTFNPERFLYNDGLLRVKSFTPFGGGSLLCPGRFMAKAEVMVFVALLIHRFEIFTTSSFPRLDTKSGAGVGILGVKDGDDSVLFLSRKGGKKNLREDNWGEADGGYLRGS